MRGGGYVKENENRLAGGAEEIENQILSMSVSEAGRSHYITSKCMYVRTP